MRKELYDSFYDGVTGLVTQPRYGYRKNGAKGMAKGIGKGIGGVFLKPPAGIHTLPNLKLNDRMLTFSCRALGPRRLSLEWAQKNAVDFARKVTRGSNFIIADFSGPR